MTGCCRPWVKPAEARFRKIHERGHVMLAPGFQTLKSLKFLFTGPLILVMLFRPAGLWPAKLRKREFAG